MKVHVEKRVLIGFLITALVLAVLGIFSFSSTQRLINTARLLTHANRVINNAEQLMKAIVDIETGQRGFVITGSEEFLEPYYESSRIVDARLNSLDSLTSQNPSQHAKVVDLRTFIQRQSRWTKNIIDTRRKNFEAARDLVAGGEGKRTTDAMREIVKSIQNEEREIFRKGNTISASHLQQFQYSFVGFAVIISIIIVYLFYLVNKNLKMRGEVERHLKRVADETRDLYDNAPCGYFSVDTNICLSDINNTLLLWLGYSRDEVIGKTKFEDLLAPESKANFLVTFPSDFEKYKRDGYVHDLEFEFIRKDQTIFSVIVSSLIDFNEKGEFTGSRTTVSDTTQRKKAEDKAKLLNQELEAFTYSVSHDLRAPLRSVAGYAQILKEDYGHKLDEEGNRVAEVIINNANRMGRLIDDLLNFSRLGRKELSKSNLDMNEMVQGVLRELAIPENGRKLEIIVNPLKSSLADISLLHQVWTNLISNALKYSRKKEIAKIEIGSFDENGQTCYYISDNGAGFDMQYVDKLFGVFQRLHKVSEFEGTGVGLALVKRIIQRHAGSVWADGKINEGAKFYFTLPAN